MGPQHHQLIYKRLYPEPTPAQALKSAKEAEKLTSYFRVGDYVRYLEYRSLFRKESDQAWSSRVFRIRRVIMSTPVTFQIEDLYGDPIKGGWYARQLIKVKPSDEEFDADDLPQPLQPPVPQAPGETILRNRYDLRSRQRPTQPLAPRYNLRTR